MSRISEKKNFSKMNIVFIAIILIQMICLVLTFVTQKTANHEDEFFSYALSNSYYRPFIYGSAHQVRDNINVWMTGDDFKYYIETNENTRFHYDSVWANQTADVHPPLYYAVLHTICSFFPNHFSWWWAFSINLICFAVTQFFLYKFINRLMGAEFPGLLACAYYGFSLAGQECALFIRMYMMLAMFAVMFVYISQTILIAKDKVEVKQYIYIGIVTFLGALTHHHFLVFAFMYTLIQCIILLIKKRIKRCFAYGGSAGVGVGLSIAAFPATIGHMMNSDSLIWTPDAADLKIQLYQYIRILINHTTGIWLPFYEMNYYADILFVLFCVLVIFAAVCFLYRRSQWFTKLSDWFKGLCKKTAQWLKTCDLSALMVIAASAFVLIVVAYKVNIMNFALESVRYFFIFIPVLIGVVVSLLYIISKRVSKKICLPILSVLLAGLLVFQNATNSLSFVMQNDPLNGKIQDYIKGQNCVVLELSGIFMPCYSIMLSETKNDFMTLTYGREFEKHEDEYKKLYENGEDFYLLFDIQYISEESGPKTMSYSDIVGYFEDISGYKATFCTEEYTHYFPVRLYKFEKQAEN